MILEWVTLLNPQTYGCSHFVDQRGKKMHSIVNWLRANCFDAYFSLIKHLDGISYKRKVSVPGSDEEYEEAQVVVAMLHLYWDIALQVNDGFGTPTHDLLRYLSIFVNSNWCQRISRW